MWNFILKHLALAQGFLDPTVVLFRLQKFSRPSEVWVPTELLRLGAVLQARGLINSQAIQHNMDWIWPYWVEQQFNPRSIAFIPRAFNMTNINLSCRNWTAIGLPDLAEFPLIDPRGMVTPLFDGWSLDAWVISKDHSLIPSRLPGVQQSIHFNDFLKVTTVSKFEGMSLESAARVIVTEDGIPVCETTFRAASPEKAWLAIALRPYNPEGISTVTEVKQITDAAGWEVNQREFVHLSAKPARYYFSSYESGDIYDQLVHADPPPEHQTKGAVSCTIGMASSAAIYLLQPNEVKEIIVKVPLSTTKIKENISWPQAMERSCRLSVPDQQFQFLYDSALRTLVLHSPGAEVYPGPFTYKRFWFRDAAFILNAMISAGLLKNIERIIDHFPKRQTPLGYYVSQDGEWDSNGQVLWIMNRYLNATRTAPKKEWLRSAYKAAQWIERKRSSKDSNGLHAGLMPAGFSAEHFGPSDHYYWDDFWSVSGLTAAAELSGDEHPARAERFNNQARDLSACIENSLGAVQKRLNHIAVPSSPYRRLDSGAVGCLIASYPLQLWSAKDPRVLETMEYLIRKHSLHGAFYHEISHSGINAYLSLHLAQTLLRAGDARFFGIVKAVADLATSTGQWPEAIHPLTKGGCMGDGQHVWAAAEWILMIRNMFVREEEKERKLILCSGIPPEWLNKPGTLSLGPTLTPYGEISVYIQIETEGIHVSWESRWHGAPPTVEIALAGHAPSSASGENNSMAFAPHSAALPE